MFIPPTVTCKSPAVCCVVCVSAQSNVCVCVCTESNVCVSAQVVVRRAALGGRQLRSVITALSIYCFCTIFSINMVRVIKIIGFYK